MPQASQVKFYSDQIVFFGGDPADPTRAKVWWTLLPHGCILMRAATLRVLLLPNASGCRVLCSPCGSGLRIDFRECCASSAHLSVPTNRIHWFRDPEEGVWGWGGTRDSVCLRHPTLKRAKTQTVVVFSVSEMPKTQHTSLFRGPEVPKTQRTLVFRGMEMPKNAVCNGVWGFRTSCVASKKT